MYYASMSWKQPALITTPPTVASVFRAHQARTPHAVPLVATSGAFDPLHVGHLQHLHAAALLKGDEGFLVVIVNGDDFLIRKKGYAFMPLDERLELLAAIRGIDFVVPWDDGSQTVTGAIEAMQPNIFAKGGDKSQHAVPEYETCVRLGCSVVFGIGGHTNVQSSSELVRRMQQRKR